MKFNEAFPSKYIKEADLNGQPMVVTFTKYTLGQYTDGKPAHEYEVAQMPGKTLGMNKTNFKTIAEMYGLGSNPDMQDIVGKSVTLVPSLVTVDGSVKKCIRVHPDKPQSVPAPAQPQAATAMSDDDIPF